ncbi:MAG: pilus assembly protein PilM [Methylotetracoccus sp.]|jgi:type IV pilus assembly protein PilM|nr:pilus assembly protein PilM [Methylotetracoccus sp.]
MFKLRRQKPALLGIDISSAAVKLLELSRDGSTYRVESIGVAPLPQGAVVDKTLANVELIGQAIQSAVKRSGTKLKHAALAVPTSVVIAKTIQMPASLTDEELELQVNLEADRYVPYPLDEVRIDFEVLGPNEKNREWADVLLVASRRENVEDRVAAVEFAGLKADVVDVESYAIENAFELLPDVAGDHDSDVEPAIAIADVGATTMTLSVIHGGRCIFNKEQGFGGRGLTELIQQKFGLTYAEAGHAKKLGTLPANYITEVLEPFKQSMAQQINVAMQFFHSSSANRGIDKLILAGGCASIRGMGTCAESMLGIPTTIANPFANMSVAQKVKPETMTAEAPAMMVACGLALRSFD